MGQKSRAAEKLPISVVFWARNEKRNSFLPDSLKSRLGFAVFFPILTAKRPQPGGKWRKVFPFGFGKACGLMLMLLFLPYHVHRLRHTLRCTFACSLVNVHLTFANPCCSAIYTLIIILILVPFRFTGLG